MSNQLNQCEQNFSCEDSTKHQIISSCSQPTFKVNRAYELRAKVAKETAKFQNSKSPEIRNEIEKISAKQFVEDLRQKQKTSNSVNTDDNNLPYEKLYEVGVKKGIYFKI